MPRTSVQRLDRHIGSRLRSLRLKMKLSMEAVGEILELSPQQIHRFELGQQRISASQLYQLARGLNVPVSWFYLDYRESREETERLKMIMETNPGTYQSGSDGELEQALITAWRGLASNRQRQSVLNLVESYSLK